MTYLDVLQWYSHQFGGSCENADVCKLGRGPRLRTFAFSRQAPKIGVHITSSMRDEAHAEFSTDFYILISILMGGNIRDTREATI